ncbi:MAG: DUF4395 domain-containing protein [Hydrogenophaga sp.]|nr:DUF4395 domain-containing protein [Hydrogenophaga sp.]
MTLFQFGQTRPEFAVPVLNERAVRASAGILFAVALIAFMHAFLQGNFQPTRVFVVAFVIEFAVRLFVNPQLAPVYMLGQWVVRHQQPEWVGAPQKRFAWGIGLALGLSMFWLLVVQQVIGPVNMLVCGLCLVFMFFESVFGICIGCKVYNLFNKEQAQLCPGGVCETNPAPRERLPARTRAAQAAVLLGFAVVVLGSARWVSDNAVPTPAQWQNTPTSNSAPAADPAQATDPAEVERCKVPEFAKAIGHEAMWKLHNGCPP